MTKIGAFKRPVFKRSIFERDRWICQICHKKIDMSLKAPHPMSATIDHIIPLSEGGKHEPLNVQAAHYGCNASKGNRKGGQLRFA